MKDLQVDDRVIVNFPEHFTHKQRGAVVLKLENGLFGVMLYRGGFARYYRREHLMTIQEHIVACLGADPCDEIDPINPIEFETATGALRR